MNGTAGPRLVWAEPGTPVKGKRGWKMQTTMSFDACAECGQPVRPREPAMQTASVDIIDGRAVASPARSYHIEGGCYDAAKRRERDAEAA